MATSLQDAPPRKCGLVRTWFPALALPLGALAVVLIRLLTPDETADVYKTMGVFVAGGLPIVAVLVWLLFFAPWPRSVRLPVFAVLVGVWCIVARALAHRLNTSSEKDDAGRIRLAFVLLYGRPATERELQLGLAFLQPAAGGTPQPGLNRWEQYAQVLLAANEFLYID